MRTPVANATVPPDLPEEQPPVCVRVGIVEIGRVHDRPGPLIRSQRREDVVVEAVRVDLGSQKGRDHLVFASCPDGSHSIAHCL